jgi:hypothetical protein
MPDAVQSLGIEVVAWLGILSVIVLVFHRGPVSGVGLTMAYSLCLSAIHLSGALVYLCPWYSASDSSVVEAGFRQSTIAFGAFGAGATCAAFLGRRLLSLDRRRSEMRDVRGVVSWYMLCGGVLYIFLAPLYGRVPSIGAVVSSGSSVLVAGLVLGYWGEWRRRRIVGAVGWIAFAFCLPAASIVSYGFLGYGAVALVAILTFARGVGGRIGFKGVLVGAILAYVGLSFYVSYMRDRSEIRESVWAGESIERRGEQLYEVVSALEWLDPYDIEHLARIDERLNQNTLVGLAVDYLRSGQQTFAQGDTLWQAAIAVVPRALWPGKPIVAGSMDLVSDYTGIQFSEGTSVGIGQVMEFYINFGIAGVLGGFALVGIVVGSVDLRAYQHLVSGDYRGFAYWYVPGLSLLQVGGSLVEITSSAAAGLIVVVLVNGFLGRRKGNRWRASELPTGDGVQMDVLQRDKK